MTKTAEELREWAAGCREIAYGQSEPVHDYHDRLAPILDQAAAELDRLRAALDAMTTEGSTGISYVTANGVPMAMPKRIQSIVKQALEHPQ